jgi:hypothetical protein
VEVPRAHGVPTWQSQNSGEKLMMKLPEPFRWLADLDAPLDESVGRRLADWARGGPGHDPRNVGAATVALADIERNLAASAEQGTEALRTFWNKLSPAEQLALKPVCDTIYKPRAASVDKGETP